MADKGTREADRGNAGRDRGALRRIGGALKAFIKIHEPGPAMVFTLLGGATAIFVLAYVIGNWA